MFKAGVCSLPPKKGKCNQWLTSLQILHSQQKTTELYLLVQQRKGSLNSNTDVCNKLNSQDELCHIRIIIKLAMMNILHQLHLILWAFKMHEHQRHVIVLREFINLRCT